MLFSGYKFLISLFTENNWEPPKAGDWATWFGVVGALATLIMTIRIATIETRRRERSERAIAVVSAATFEMQIADCVACLSNALNYMESYMAERGSTKIGEQARDYILHAPILRTADAAYLIAISPSLAVELARSGSLLARIQVAIAKPTHPGLPQVAAQIQEMLGRRDECGTLLDSFQRCLASCKSAQTEFIS